MKIALLADIHGNREALDATLADVRRRGCDQFVFLGDIVGYGADPVAVTEIVAAAVSDGAIAILGNHDEAVTRLDCDMNANARAAIVWTRSVLGPKHFSFLSGLPIQHRQDGLLHVHADACAPAAWHYVTGVREAERSIRSGNSEAVTFVGHVHVSALYFLAVNGTAQRHAPTPGHAIPLSHGRRWLAVIGAVGQPRDGTPLANWACYDTQARLLTFHRVVYDHHAAARKVLAAGLPAVLAQRLLAGS